MRTLLGIAPLIDANQFFQQFFQGGVGSVRIQIIGNRLIAFRNADFTLCHGPLAEEEPDDVEIGLLIELGDRIRRRQGFIIFDIRKGALGNSDILRYKCLSG